LCLAQSEYIDEAIEQLNHCIEIDPNHADAYYNLGVAYGFKEEKNKSIEMFDKALEIQPDHILAGHGKQIMEG